MAGQWTSGRKGHVGVTLEIAGETPGVWKKEGQREWRRINFKLGNSNVG